MSTIQTYHGVVRQGHIKLETGFELPEGSQVYVIVAGQEPLLAENEAKRKATRWLVEYVGNMLMAQEGRLLNVDDRVVWRFGAFITARGYNPYGPIGYVDVDALVGNVLADEQKAEEMIAHGAAVARSLPRTER